MFSQKFMLYGATPAALLAAYNTLKAAMEVPYKNLSLKYLDQTFLSTNQATHVGGFNLKPIITIEEQKGLHWLCKFTTGITLPADTLGTGVSPFQEGLVEVSCNVDIPETNLYSMTFEGEFRVVSTAVTAMSTAYEAAIKALLDTYYLGVYHAGRTWDVQLNNYNYDHTNKIGTFSYTYREVPIPYTGSGGTKYILSEHQIFRNLNREFAPIPIGSGKGKGSGSKKSFFSGSTGSGRTGYFVGGKGDGGTTAPVGSGPGPPIEYIIEGVISIKKDQLTDTQAVSIYDSEVRAWLLAHLNTTFGMKLHHFEDEEERISGYTKKLGFRLKGYEFKSGTMMMLDVTEKTPESEDYVFSKIYDSKKYHENFWQRIPELTKTITIDALQVNKEITRDFFDKFKPAEYSDKTKKGWIMLKATPTKKVKLRNKIDKNITYYYQGMTFEFKYLDHGVEHKPSANILSSYMKRK